MPDKLHPTNGKRAAPLEEPAIHASSYQLASALRNEAVGWVAKGAVGAAGLLMTIAATGLWFYFERLIPEIARGVPGGAILAFDRVDCPKGWHPYKQVISRVIIGWGAPDKEQKYSVDAHNKALQSHTFAEVGGEETRFKIVDNERLFASTVLQTDSADQNLRPSPATAFGPGTNSHANADPPPTPSQRLVVVEGDQAEHHSSMPPYIALNYCQKDYQD